MRPKGQSSTGMTQWQNLELLHTYSKPVHAWPVLNRHDSCTKASCHTSIIVQQAREGFKPACSGPCFLPRTYIGCGLHPSAMPLNATASDRAARHLLEYLARTMLLPQLGMPFLLAALRPAPPSMHSSFPQPIPWIYQLALVAWQFPRANCSVCRQEGQPLEERLVAALAGQGFSQQSSPPVWLQSFEVEVSIRLQQLHHCEVTCAGYRVCDL